MLDDWTNSMSGKPRVKMLLNMPDHRLAYINSIDAHCSKQSAKPLKDRRKNGCLLLHKLAVHWLEFCMLFKKLEEIAPFKWILR